MFCWDELVGGKYMVIMKKLGRLAICVLLCFYISAMQNTEASLPFDNPFDMVSMTMEDYYNLSEADKRKYWQRRYDKYLKDNKNNKNKMSYNEFRREYEADMEYYYKQEQEKIRRQQEVEQQRIEQERAAAEEAERQRQADMRAKEEAKQKQLKKKLEKEMAENEAKWKEMEERNIREQKRQQVRQDKIIALLAGAILGVVAFGILIKYK